MVYKYANHGPFCSSSFMGSLGLFTGGTFTKMSSFSLKLYASIILSKVLFYESDGRTIFIFLCADSSPTKNEGESETYDLFNCEFSFEVLAFYFFGPNRLTSFMLCSITISGFSP